MTEIQYLCLSMEILSTPSTFIIASENSLTIPMFAMVEVHALEITIVRVLFWDILEMNVKISLVMAYKQI